MRNNTYKIDRIKNFIDKKNPTRKELVMFIVINIGKKCTLKEYDHNRYRGQYSTAITQWKYNGQVEVKDGRYQLTKIGKQTTNKSLYGIPDKILIKRLEERLEDFRRWANERGESSYDEIKKLKAMNYQLALKVTNLHQADEYQKGKDNLKYTIELLNTVYNNMD
jgi:hypothetical protein